MQHYDGPAFYRMQKAREKNEKTTNNLMRARTKSYKNVKSEGTKIFDVKLKKDGRSSGRLFRPTYVPPSITTVHRFTSEEARYEHLFGQLKKKKETYFLLGGEEESDSKVIILADENTETGIEPIVEQREEHKGTGKNSEFNQSIRVPSLNTDNTDNDDQNDIFQKENASFQEEHTTSFTNKSEVQDSPIDDRLSKKNSNQTGITMSEQQTTKAIAADHSTELQVPVVNTVKKQISKDLVPAGEESKNSVIETKFEQVTADSENNKVREARPRVHPHKTTDVSETDSFLQDQTAVKLEAEKKNKINGHVGQNILDETTMNGEYHTPPISLLPAPVKNEDESMDEWVLTQIDVLNETFKSFNVKANVKDWTIGPAVTQFEVVLGRGVKVNKITNLSDDLKLALAAKDIRIEAPIPGKSSVGVEIPNLHSRPVMLSEVLTSTAFTQKESPLTVALGVDLFGCAQVTDLRKMPHGLIAGATGSGKSVFINSILVSLLYKATPAQVKLLLIDPKAVELAPYHEIPHLLSPVISDPAAAAAALKWAVEEMEERYQRLAAGGARNIEAFNAKAEKHGDFGLKMPYIVIIIDELADLMMAASSEVQDYIARITQKARAAGIHLIIATQRPSVDVITGTIKNNIPTRVAFMVSSQVDSRTILDCSGAERLLGRGDMLYLGNGASQPRRLQGTFVENEIDQITDFVRTQGKPQYAFDPDGLKQEVERSDQEDELFPRVLDYIVSEENISTSKLQRVFSIGYNRAANIIDELEHKRYISPARGSKPRDVFLTQTELDKLRD